MHTVLPGFVETEGFPQRTKLRSALLRRFVIEADDVARAIVERGREGQGRGHGALVPVPPRSIAQALVPGLFARLARRAGQHRDE